jgi:phospho-N-acetylmuramoyl-pentapeptide-transferase
LLWVRWDSKFYWIALLSILWYGAIGFADDYWKLVGKGKQRGISGLHKLIFQFIGAILIVYLYLMVLPDDFYMKTYITLPFFKHPVNLDALYPFFGVLVIVSASNAVNLTDGLDGLAIVPTIIAAGVFALIAYLVGNRIFADYLQLNFVPGVGELAVFCSALIGAGLGFLWFNAPPAAVFMGDTGALAIGGALGAVSVATKHEVVLGIVGGLFVVETVSVIIQVFWFKQTGRRVFLMAPLHHHFEKKGWQEPTVVIRFWIVAVILALVGLGTLKIR